MHQDVVVNGVRPRELVFLGVSQHVGAAPFDLGLDEMRAALRLAGLLDGGGRPFDDGGREMIARGPAAITYLPLSTAPPAIGTSGLAAAMRDLNAAMLMAGLSEERQAQR